jgi:hypothetical protein
MFKDVRELVKEHQVFYEVSPYNLLIDEQAGSPPASTRTIQAGFDVDIYGVNTNDEPALPGPDYALGYAEVRKVTTEISHRTSNSCSLEVIPFPSRIVIGAHAELEGMLRIRISHRRGLDQAAGPPEGQALKELENRLKDLGIPRR